MRRRVQTHDVARWAEDFLRGLERSAAANDHLLEDLAGEPDVAIALTLPDVGATGSVTTRDTSRSAQGPSMDVDVELPSLTDVGAAGGRGEQVE